MHLKTEPFNQFVAVAADLYPTKASVESVLIGAGIPVQAVNLTDTGITMWNSALSYADQHNKHEELLRIIEGEYGHKPELQQLKKAVEDGSAFITPLSYKDYIEPTVNSTTAEVFVIYDEGDFKPYVEELRMQLNALTFPPSVVHLSTMYQVAAGVNREEEQLKRLGTADIVLLCLTPRFFGNPESNCIPLAFAAFQMSKWLVPVLLVPCLWNRIKFLQDIHPLPKNGLFATQWNDPQQAYLHITNGVQEVAEKLKKSN